jgi:hypothetical protein
MGFKLLEVMVVCVVVKTVSCNKHFWAERARMTCFLVSVSIGTVHVSVQRLFVRQKQFTDDARDPRGFDLSLVVFVDVPEPALVVASSIITKVALESWRS